MKISEQIREDLTGLLGGEVRSDLGTLSLYATDASLHQVLPLSIVYPRNADDVAATVRYAAENQLPVIARGAGTGLAGGCLGSGIVVDFSRHMNQILEIRDHEVVVQPGVVLDDLNRALAATGRYFAADPSNSAITTIGGMIGVDAAGSRALMVGSTRDHLRAVQVILADGTAHWLGHEPVTPGVSSGLFTGEGEEHDNLMRLRVTLRRLAAILKESETLIAEHQPLLLRNTAGYMLRGVLQHGALNMPRLFAGSEGTLGICTEAVLHTLPLPASCHVMLVLFSRFDLATQALPGILDFEPSACDLLDRRLLTLAREASEQHEVLISSHAEAALIVEFIDSSETHLQKRSERFLRYVQQNVAGATVAVHASTPESVQKLWLIPRQVVPMLARIKGRSRPVPIIEDIVIPPHVLGEFLHQAQRVLQRFQVTASLYAHAGTGQLHLRPFLEMPTKETKGDYESLARELYRVVLEFGGSISGEHGDGYSRTAFIRTQYGPLYRVFQQIKQLFDPRNILNPEKIVSSDPHLTIRHLRADAELVSLKTESENQLQWTNSEMGTAAGQCNGCGQCKAAVPSGQRMCPFSRVEKSEPVSPRAKANTIRQYLTTCLEASPEETSPALADFTAVENLESCFNCKQCQIECPSQVDIPHLWLEAKSAHVLQNGLDRTDWLLSRLSEIADLAWRFSLPVNWLLRTRTGRWLLEKVAGIDSRRKLATLTKRPYLEQMRIRNRRKKTADPPMVSENGEQKAVVIFLDYFANHHEPQVVEALEAILRHHNIPYVVPLEQEVSGISHVNIGDLPAAREIAEINLRVLGPYAREGHPIVCLEPSSAVCLSQEYPLLLEHPDAKSLAAQTCEAGGYLLKLLERGQLRTDFSPLPVQIGYHEPCHQRALRNQNPYHLLLPRIPELQLKKLDKGCSGMAGTFGLSTKNYEKSLQIGAALLDAVMHENFQLASSECAACRMQMQHADAKPVIHPLKLLAAAYRLIALPALK